MTEPRTDQNSNPVLDSMMASRDSRSNERRADEKRLLQVSAGKLFPSTDELLRGVPFFGADLALDMTHFWGLLCRDTVLTAVGRESEALAEAVDRVRKTREAEDVRAVAQILQAIAGNDGAFREERLRCRLYLGALGDAEAALELAMDAITAAYRQEWHRVGDGSLPVWMALGWLAQAAASRSRENLASGTAISPKSPPEVRVLSVADDLRTRVERCLLELHSVGD